MARRKPKPSPGESFTRGRVLTEADQAIVIAACSACDLAYHETPAYRWTWGDRPRCGGCGGRLVARPGAERLRWVPGCGPIDEPNTRVIPAGTSCLVSRGGAWTPYVTRKDVAVVADEAAGDVGGRSVFTTSCGWKVAVFV